MLKLPSLCPTVQQNYDTIHNVIIHKLITKEPIMMVSQLRWKKLPLKVRKAQKTKMSDYYC
jgi:hypothetical protein